MWPWGYRIRCFLVAIFHDSKEIKLENSDQEASPSVFKNAGIVLVPCRTAIFGGVDVTECYGSPSLSFVMTWVIREAHKYYFKDECLMCFTNIWSGCSNFDVFEFFRESSTWYSRFMWEKAWKNQVILNNLALRSYLSLIQKHFITHIHGLAGTFH